MKRAAVLFLFLSYFASANAQHCPFDYLGILVVSVTDATTGEAVHDASIKIVDKDGIAHLDWKDDALRFVRNPEATNPFWTNDDFKDIRFSFAQDYFILPLSLELAKEELQIKVESDVNDFETIYYSLSPTDYFELHENIGDWTELRNLDESPEVAFDKLIIIEVER